MACPIMALARSMIPVQSSSDTEGIKPVTTWPQHRWKWLGTLLPLSLMLYACGNSSPNLGSTTGESSATIPCDTTEGTAANGTEVNGTEANGAEANGAVCTMPPPMAPKPLSPSTVE